MTALFLIAVVLLVLANGFFVAAEFALVRTRRGNIEELAKEGRRGAATAVRLMDDLSQYLSACQLGITLASLAIGFLGEPDGGRRPAPALLRELLQRRLAGAHERELGRDEEPVGEDEQDDRDQEERGQAASVRPRRCKPRLRGRSSFIDRLDAKGSVRPRCRRCAGPSRGRRR